MSRQNSASPRPILDALFIPAVGALPPRLTMVGLAPLSYPLVGAAVGAWGAAPVFVGCGILGGLGAAIALASDAVRHAELPRRQPDMTT